jgi:hypothetical protein
LGYCTALLTLHIAPAEKSENYPEPSVTLAERGPMLPTAETGPSHYLPHLNTNIFQLQIDHLLKMSVLVFCY